MYRLRLEESLYRKFARIATQIVQRVIAVPAEPFTLRTYSSNLLLEQGDLALVVGGAAARAAGGAYYR
jgi:predicted RNA methylase